SPAPGSASRRVQDVCPSGRVLRHDGHQPVRILGRRNVCTLPCRRRRRRRRARIELLFRSRDRSSTSSIPLCATTRDSRGRRGTAGAPERSQLDGLNTSTSMERTSNMPARRKSVGPFLAAMALSLLLGFGLARGLMATDDLRSQLDLFTQVLYLVQNHYVEAPDNEKLIHGAIDGMLKTLDPHTVFLPPQRAQRMDEEFRGDYSGIGIQFEIRDGVITVISPLEGTPAYRLGIRAGDQIVEIDGKPVPKTVTNDDVFKALRGPSGSQVQIAIQREGEDVHRYTIDRAKIPI